MPRLSKRQFLKGAGILALALGAGYPVFQGLHEDKEEWSAEPRGVPDNAPRELEPILMEIAHYQKYRLEEFNERMADDSFRPPIDPWSVQNTVAESGSASWQEKYDVHTTFETNRDSAYDDIAKRLELKRGEEEVATILGGSITIAIDPLMYIPIAGQEGDQHYDPHHYESFEGYLGAIKCTVSDHADNETGVSIPEDDVDSLWETVTNKEKGDSFSDILRYVQENMDVRTAE